TRYTSSIISNCYLLTSDNIRVLAEARLNHLQVTLDGPKQFHNKRRFLICGHSSATLRSITLQSLLQLYMTSYACRKKYLTTFSRRLSESLKRRASRLHQVAKHLVPCSVALYQQETG